MIGVESSKMSSQTQQKQSNTPKQTSPEHQSSTNNNLQRNKLFLFDAIAAGLSDQTSSNLKTQSIENAKQTKSDKSGMMIKALSKPAAKQTKHHKNSQNKVIIDMNNLTTEDFIDINSTITSNKNTSNNDSNKSINVLNTNRSVKNIKIGSHYEDVNLIDSTYNNSDNNFNLFKNDLEEMGSIFASSSVGTSLANNEKRKNYNKDQVPILIVSNGVKQNNYHFDNSYDKNDNLQNRLNKSFTGDSNEKIKFRLKHYEFKNNLNLGDPKNIDKTITSAKIINNSLLNKIKFKKIHLKNANTTNNINNPFDNLNKSSNTNINNAQLTLKPTSTTSNGKNNSKNQRVNSDHSNSKSSNYSEMDVSSPFADVKQISVQNKPLGGKKIQIQSTNAFNTGKFGIETKQIPNTSVTKYASVSNGSLNSLSGNLLNNHNHNIPVNNLIASTTTTAGSQQPQTNTSTNNLTNNLMRSLLTANKSSNQNRSFFNHINSSSNQLNNSNISINNSNIFNNDQNQNNDKSAYTLVSANMNNSLNTSNSTAINNTLISNNNLNNSIITATMQLHHHNINTNTAANNNPTAIRNSNNVNSLPIREKSNAQLASSNNMNGSASRDSKVNLINNLRKDNSFYVSTKENNNSTIQIGSASYKSNSNNNISMNKNNQNLNNSQVDTNSILNSFYANNSTASNGSHPNLAKARSSHLAQNRSVLSSKQINNQSHMNSNNNNNISNANHSSHHHLHQNHHKADCLTSSEALQLYGDKLVDFEKQEINEYAEIWFLGLEAEKLHVNNVKEYDDENGAYLKVNKDHIAYRYEIIETLGKGSFGQVLKCFDHKKKEYVAVKIIRSKKRFQQQGMVEVNILQHLKNLDTDNTMNVVHMKEYFYFRNHLCITFEILGINLYELIKKNNYQGFSIHLVRRFAYSILQCMRVMLRESVVHCDLKPENILLRQKGSSAIKVIDFGSGCFESQRIYTYIQSRFYRAPEIILGIPYTTSIDMWSFGCILVELYTGYPIFPGENEAEQLAMIMEVIDLPPAHILAEASRRKLFFDSKNMPRNLNSKLFKKRRVGSRSLAQILKTNDSNFIDFVSRCIEWDPNVRMNAEEALKHPFILELKKKSSKENNTSRPKHRLRREAENSVEHDNTHIKNFNTDNTFNEYHFQKHLNLLQNTIDINDHDLDDKKNNSNSFFPPLH